MKEKLTNLLKLKSIVTLLMTIALIIMLFVTTEPNKEVLAVFCTSYGAIITYFFTRKESENRE